jgi:hypothetical protein
MKKLTPAKIAQIRARRDTGESLESLSKAFKLSIGSIHNALKRSTAPNGPPKPSREPPTASAPAQSTGEPAAPPTHDDLRRWLGEQVTSLRADAERYRAEGNQPALATTNRALVAASALLERVTPPDPNVAPAGMMLVPVAEMEAEAEKGEARLLQAVKGAIDERATWPTCSSCRLHVPPPDIGKRVAEMSEVSRLFVSLMI